MRDPPFFERPEERLPDDFPEDERPLLPDDLTEDFPREPLEPRPTEDDLDRPEDFALAPELFEDLPEDLLLALARDEPREELLERALDDDFLLPYDLYERADFFPDDFLPLIALFEPPERLENPPDLYIFFDEPDLPEDDLESDFENDFDLKLFELFLREVLNGFRRLLLLAELFDFLTIFFSELLTLELDLPNLLEARYDFLAPNPRTGPSLAARAELFPDFLDRVLDKPLVEAVTRGRYFPVIRASG